ncbi:hypothetical protein SB775_25290 [Peribacillus sp. SIMBA_075]|uniref:hypothetical protein n=1 Tax=Peribacillus sp. SIMBA_075 TaxID=3085813 RepID=UPI00397AFD84
MFTTENYISTLKINLEKNSVNLIKNIKEILDLNYYNEIEILDFTVFIQPFELSIMMFSMDKEANEVFYEGNDSKIFAGSHEILGEIEYFDLQDDKMDEFWEFFEQNDKIISKAEEQTILQWFVDCWKKAKGESIKLPVYFCFHDDDKSFDLINMEWISDEGKWA